MIGCDYWLSMSIYYDLVLLDFCHLHHHYAFLSIHRDSQIWNLSRYSCLYLGSLHPRILKFTWIERECDFICHYWHKTWNPWITLFSDFDWKTCQLLLKLRESDVKRNSRHRIEVKHDSVKFEKQLSSVNFPWTWIHSPITNIHFFLISGTLMCNQDCNQFIGAY